MGIASSITRHSHPVLAGLPDKALVGFFSLANVEHHESGSLLQLASAPAEALLVLAGQLTLDSAQGTPGPVLAAGTCLPSSMLNQNGREQPLLRASGRLSVVRYSESALANLDPESQLAIQRNLAAVHAEAAASLLRQQQERDTTHLALARQVLLEREEEHARYKASRPVMELLRKLPRLPSYATRLTQLLNDSEVSMREAFESAKLDPSLTASVLKTVNSAAYGLKHKVMDFQHALVLLGFNQIQQIILNRGIQSIMPKTPEFQQLQLHSVMVSALCQEIALALKQGNPPVLGTVGLLHDIGRSVLLLLKRDQPQLAFLIDLLDADLVGSLLLREWELPEDICACVQYQSLPARVAPQVVPASRRVNVAVLYLAHLCFDLLLDKPADGRRDSLCRDYLRSLGSRADTAEQFLYDELLPATLPRMAGMPKVIQNFLGKGSRLREGRLRES